MPNCRSQWNRILLILTWMAISCLSLSAQIEIVPTISTAAGDGVYNYYGYGIPAQDAEITYPYSGAVDKNGNFYFSDFGSCVVRVIYHGGTIPNVTNPVIGDIYTVAGTPGITGSNANDVLATNATLGYIYGVATDMSGNIYISDTSNYVVRVIYQGGVIPNITAHPQIGYIYTVAGTVGLSGYRGNGTQATGALLAAPYGLAIDTSGNIYIADGGLESNVIRVVFYSGSIPNFSMPCVGCIYTIAGNPGVSGYSGDGGSAISTNVTLGAIGNLAIDSNNNIYIADQGDEVIRVVYQQGNLPNITAPHVGYIYTVAGGGNGSSPGNGGFFGDGGPATSAELNFPQGISTDSIGNLYIADYSNSRVRKVTAATGIITTVAGSSQSCSQILSDGGLATSASLCEPVGLAVDTAGHIYISDWGGDRVRETSSQTEIDFAPTNVGSTSASQNVYLEALANETINVNSPPLSPSGQPEFLYNTANITGCSSGTGTINSAGTICAMQIAFDPQYAGLRSAPLVVNYNDFTAGFPMMGLGISPQIGFTPGIITTVAGNGQIGNTDYGSLATSTPVGPGVLALDTSDDLYIAGGNYVSVVNTSGNITVAAGDGVFGYNGDNRPAASASLDGASYITLDKTGNVYFVDSSNVRVRVIYYGGSIPGILNPMVGYIYTVAGGGTVPPFVSLGAATAAAFLNIAGIAFDSYGNLYIACAGDETILKMNSSGILNLFAGIVGSGGDTGDYGPATNATFGFINGLATDTNNNLYIADGYYNVIRVIYAGGTIPGINSPTVGYIYTVAGNGTYGFFPNGSSLPATSIGISNPFGIATDAAGNLYIAGRYGMDVLKVDPYGMMTSIAGIGGNEGYNGDNIPATVAQLSDDSFVLIDSAGNVLISDSQNARIRKVTVNQSALPYITSTPIGSMDTVDGPQTLTVSNNGNGILVFEVPASGTNPSIGSDFTYDSASSCPLLSPGATSFTLAPGASCTYVVDFTPTTRGTLTEALVLSTNDPNTPDATVSLSGTGGPEGMLPGQGCTPSPHHPCAE